jgi:hypothetical protein
LKVICRVDPPSEGVEMARTQSISLDVGGHDVVAHFGGMEEVGDSGSVFVIAASHRTYRNIAQFVVGLLMEP